MILSAHALSLTIPGVIIEPTTDYKGRIYRRFYAARPSIGTGWIVRGRNEGYGDRLVMDVARPDRPYRKTARFNGPVKMGWKTMREANAIAEKMNAYYADVIA